ncbi:type II secretion system protein M, partial [Pseudomonas aeruginosa]|nr:type II secretion system protein M [Pseudomonas aeruginosa]
MNRRLAGFLTAPAQRWNPLLRRAQAYWRRLAPRERRTVAGGGLALGLALTWQLFVEPPLARIEHWQAELPRAGGRGGGGGLRRVIGRRLALVLA